jgi:hypothetical protein
LLGIVRRQWLMGDFGFAFGQFQHLLGLFQHRKFLGIAKIDRTDKILAGLHQDYKRIDEIVDIAKRTRLAAVAVDHNIFPTQSLHNKDRVVNVPKDVYFGV